MLCGYSEKMVLPFSLHDIYVGHLMKYIFLWFLKGTEITIFCALALLLVK